MTIPQQPTYFTTEVEQEDQHQILDGELDDEWAAQNEQCIAWRPLREKVLLNLRDC